MRTSTISRRTFLKNSAGAALCVFAQPVRAAAPVPTAITPALIEAARREGKVSFYTAMDIAVAEKFGKAFEAKYPGVAVRVERSGAERIFQRIAQEKGSNINAVDVVNTADAAHVIVWKRNGWLEPYVPEDVAKHFPLEHKDPDGMFASQRAWLSVIGYNTKLVPAAEAPKSFADLLDPKWAGKIVKAHPGYSGTILTATHQIARDLGWSYFEKLAQQKIMQVQSATDPPKKLALGERAIMADGGEYVALQMKEKGDPIEIVYPAEGTPLIVGPNAIFKNAPNPNAARLLQSYMFTPEGQQVMIDSAGMHSAHPLTKEKPGRTSLSQIKLMKDDAEAVERETENLKKRYTQIFKV